MANKNLFRHAFFWRGHLYAVDCDDDFFLYFCRYERKLTSYLQEYDKALIVKCDNVRSKQFQDIRRALRPESVILMGKNTMMKRCLRAYFDRIGDTRWQPLLDVLRGNVGIIFTKAQLNDVREHIAQFVVPAPAKAGAIAPRDVVVESGSTGMGPETTSFFQALNIATKINKGTVEILQNVQIVNANEKVSSSAAALLGKLKKMPFEYGLVVEYVMENGTIYSPKVLDITNEDLKKAFAEGVKRVASLSLGADYPNLASTPHMFANAFKTVLSVSIATDYTIKQAEDIKSYLANPSAFLATMAAAAPASGASAGQQDEGGAGGKEEEEEEEEEEVCACFISSVIALFRQCGDAYHIFSAPWHADGVRPLRLRA